MPSAANTTPKSQRNHPQLQDRAVDRALPGHGDGADLSGFRSHRGQRRFARHAGTGESSRSPTWIASFTSSRRTNAAPAPATRRSSNARGEFLAFLDSDDTWYPEHLASQMKQFDDDPTLDLAYCNSLLVGDPEREVPFMERCPSSGPATFETLVVEQCQIPISTVVVRKKSIVKAGCFDETIPRCDDYDMWVRTAFHGAKIGYIRDLTVHMYIGRPGSMSQEKAKMIEAYWNILERFKRILPLTDAQRHVVDQRATEIRTRYSDGRREASARRTVDFDKARELFAEANRNLKTPRLSVVLFGLKIAPKVTGKLVALWGRVINSVSLFRMGGARPMRS